ncbi:serine hydrolase domain-containing protein [Maribellus sediminis]|uniref:serine hydrolase domain-containing protein n=1 Tax=Maribellus sediminis TaxID=2696285 RepID=UPI001430FBA9|nr:serine hydrolase [Maribellus sediminis]
MKNLGITIGVVFILVFLISETGCNIAARAERYYKVPEQLNDGLKVGDAAKAGLNTELLEDATQAIENGKFKEIHSMLIYKAGQLVFEEYFEGHQYQWDAPKYHGALVQWSPTRAHPVMSCTKSITSACIGIAIDKGFIKSVDQSIFDYLPEHQYLKTDNKNYISIEHLLTMTSGLAWDEWNASHGGQLTNDYDHLYVVDDQIKAVLERPFWAAPGEYFTYNGGGIDILGEIMKNATGMDMDEFAAEYLFKPLGIDSATWWRYPNGRLETASSLSLTPRDMLKFGALYLNNGRWNGQQIIPEDWVEKSATVYRNNSGIQLPIEDSGANGYAYTWWISELDHNGQKIKMYRANGWGGQVIAVIPELDMVMVFTSGNWATKSKLFKLVNNYILPAVNN